MKKIFALLLTLLMTVTMLAACGGTESQTTTAAAESGDSATSEYAEYIGNTYYAEDPWGGKASFQVVDEGDHVECLYTDELTDSITFKSTVYMMDGNKKVDDLEMIDSGNSWEASYYGTFEMKDGTLIVTFSDGSLTIKSGEGDSDSHQVAALDEDARTVVFEK